MDHLPQPSGSHSNGAWTPGIFPVQRASLTDHWNRWSLGRVCWKYFKKVRYYLRVAHSEKLPLKSDHNEAAGAFTRTAIAATHGLYECLHCCKCWLRSPLQSRGETEDQLFFSMALSGQTMTPYLSKQQSCKATVQSHWQMHAGGVKM